MLENLMPRTDLRADTDLETITDQDLIEIIKSSPLEIRNMAIGVLFNRHTPPLSNIVLKTIGDEDVTEDVVCDTWETALKKISEFEWTGVPILAWLNKIAKNKILEYRRYNPTCLSLETLEENRASILRQAYAFIASRFDDSIAEPQTVCPHVKIEADRILHKSLSQLPYKQRSVIWLQYFEALDDHAISERLTITPAAVRTNRCRAMQRLRQCPMLKELFGGNDD